MKYLLISIFLVGCSANWHLNKALKKNPQIVQAEVQYIRDTLTQVLNGDTVKTIREIPVPVEVVKWRTRVERKSDDRIAKEEAKQAKLETRKIASELRNYKDSTRLAEKEMKLENKRLKEEISFMKQETRTLKRENRGDALEFLLDWWWVLLIIILGVLFLIKKYIK